MFPNRVLMTKPNGYKVAYAINPHMVDETGELNRVHEQKALSQWSELKSLFSRLGLEVFEMEGQSSLPDMVFCANQTFPFKKKNGETAFILSEMTSDFRKPEVAHYREWAESLGFECLSLSSNSFFEGMGDALWNYETGEIFGGYGFRTSLEVYDEIEAITGAQVHRINLIDNRFYHLDTCLAILNKSTAFAVKEAFGPSGWDILNEKFKNLIEIPLNEAINHFAGNMTCLFGTDVILQKGTSQTLRALNDLGVKVHEIETSEFMKSGGSVFCMKQLF